ncbi:MAG: hypothetical protein HFH23_17640 [Ruminococcus sp.]|nr:hypothetical protein [Ruminococcus sp.]
MKERFKRIAAMGLALALATATLAGCGKDGQGAKDDATKTSKEAFTWWIAQMDDHGQYYETYEQSPVAQFVNAQYWDVENGGIGTAENGTQLDLSFLVPIAGSESDNFNTMIGTGEYPEIMDLSFSSDSPQALYENGVLMDITEYVETYMPHYVAYLDENPELKPLVQVSDDEGNVHYYALYSLSDGVETPWTGTCYRRDLVVKFAEPTDYVWDWENDYVQENGHPAVTPLEQAKKEKNMEGWKENDVTAFEADYGENPASDYTDNVVFPSGTNDPLTISDWEWMFEAFDKAAAARGWADDTGAYGFSIPYQGFSQLGDLVSSFGGGTGSYYVKDGEVSFDGTSENFKTYLECVREWYKNGWIDSQFYTRAADMFFQIDTTNVKQGKVGMWTGLSSDLGSAIAPSCQNEEDKKDAFVMGCALPINDKYGSDKQKFVEPDALFQSSRKGSALGITTKAEGRDLSALFTYFDWMCTLEGAATIRIGLNAEQYASVDLDPDLYEEYDIKTAYTVEEGEDGVPVYKPTFTPSETLEGAVMGHRMATGISLTGSGKLCRVEKVSDAVYKKGEAEWMRYVNTGNVMDYTSLLAPEESDAYSKISTAVSDYQAQNFPYVVMGEKTWDEYVSGLEALNPDSAVEYLQKYVDVANTTK